MNPKGRFVGKDLLNVLEGCNRCYHYASQDDLLRVDWVALRRADGYIGLKLSLRGVTSQGEAGKVKDHRQQIPWAMASCCGPHGGRGSPA